MGPGTPPGWPAGVPGPSEPGWERRAVNWLLDLAPGDWRGIEVLVRQPTALAALVSDHVAATRTGLRASVAGLRSRLAGAVPHRVVEEVVTALMGQEAVLARVAREVSLIEDALRRPKSQTSDPT